MSGRYLLFPEREQLALLRAQGHGVREIARRLKRAPSTISRELRRNAATRSGGLDYRAVNAQWHADRIAATSRKVSAMPESGGYAGGLCVPSKLGPAVAARVH